MPMQPLAVFSYWSETDRSAHDDFVDHWKSAFPQFRLFGDGDVRPLIQRHFSEWLELYDDIRIPTAKSDIALLILLHHFGGLYVDCHCGIVDAEETERLLSTLIEYDAIFIDRNLSMEPRDPEEHLVINSIIMARPRLQLLLRMCRRAFQNFERRRYREQRSGFSEYDIWSLSGPGLITAMLLEPGSFNHDVREDYRERIEIIREESAPIARNRFRAYSVPGRHWSERQKTELLFGRASERIYGLSPEDYAHALAVAERPDLLRALVDTSRRAFGFVAASYGYNFHYCWTAARLDRIPAGSRILDFGTGINPLPLYFAERGIRVDCVDNNESVRKLPANEEWNEWGFFDYGALHENLTASHCSIVDFVPTHSYDAIYSVCAIAHFHSSIRRATLNNCWLWLKPGGVLLLLIDLIPGTDHIWNITESGREAPESHGTYRDLEDEIRRLGFAVTDCRIQRRIRYSRTDLYYLMAEKAVEDA